MSAQAHIADEARLKRLQAASEWVVLLNSEDCCEADTAAWLRWCDEDPENFDAFESLQRDWHDLDALKTGQRAQAVPAYTPKSRWQGVALAAAASVLFAVAIAGYWVFERSEPKQLVAAARVNKAATLPDGSSLVLGAKTTVNVDFTGAERHLALSEGLAYFKVQHDAQRPFIVQAGEVSVKAVGTAFDVRREQDRVIVTVEEGVVEVTSAARSGDATPKWRAEAGYQLSYSTSGARGPVATIASIDPSAALKWRDGEFAYVWEPLGSVVADLNRYSSHRIVLADDRVASMRYTGTVFATSVDDWLQAVQQTYPVRVRQAANGDVVLEAAP